MNISDQLASAMLQKLSEVSNDTGTPEAYRLRDMLNLLASYRQMFLLKEFYNHHGLTVQSGPFKGLELKSMNIQPVHLMGVYEQPLHSTIEAIIEHGYDHIVNIGCAVGYYAIGMARRMSGTHIHAYDIDEVALGECKKAADVNGVSDRLTFGSEFRGEDFANIDSENTLVFMDIEGGERELLNPVKFPALGSIDILVEVHDCFDPTTTELIRSRFMGTHDIEWMPNASIHVEFPEFLWTASELDQSLAAWEGRPGPTPWAMMRVRK